MSEPVVVPDMRTNVLRRRKQAAAMGEPVGAGSVTGARRGALRCGCREGCACGRLPQGRRKRVTGMSGSG